MVKLHLQSPYSQTETPFLYKWDNEFRKNYEFYQNEIDKLTYHLQRSLKGIGPFGSWRYPYSQQHNFLLLEIYKKKQLIGKIFPDEIEGYSRLNSNILEDLNRTFRVVYDVPYVGLGTAGVLNVYAHLFNLPYSFRFGFLLVPVTFEMLYRVSRVGHKVNTIQFLDWLIQYRTARSQIELDTPYFQRDSKQIFQKFRHITKSTRSPQELFNDILQLVAEESHEELKFDNK